MIPIFPAKNINNKIIIKDKKTFESYLNGLPEEVIITVSKHKKQRSRPQNSYLWGVVYALISEHTGYEAEEVHEICKLRFNCKPVKVGKDEFIIGVSTASLTTIEFETYISKIVMWASFDLGLIIPEPSDVKGD